MKYYTLIAQICNKYARLAQLVEQLIYTEKVVGSSPTSRTIIKASQSEAFIIVSLLYQARTFFQNK
ncbi:MAG: hypothetical protein QG669_114 [Patescibacteria group bacterium]|nr:hypothetical protein [Patescibacteria group bacterium]MDQ5961722.1 hypothetical protein [Patescibacteria group bacterium]